MHMRRRTEHCRLERGQFAKDTPTEEVRDSGSLKSSLILYDYLGPLVVSYFSATSIYSNFRL